MPKHCDSSDFSISESCETSETRPCRSYDAGSFAFTSIITPLNNLHTPTSECLGGVEFRMRRKNKVVTLQWESFKGRLTTNGIAYICVNQSIFNLPPYPVSIPIYMKYNGVGRITHVEIDPHSSYNIKFYLNSDGSATNISKDDNVNILAGCVNWIVD